MSAPTNRERSSGPVGWGGLAAVGQRGARTLPRGRPSRVLGALLGVLVVTVTGVLLGALVRATVFLVAVAALEESARVLGGLVRVAPSADPVYTRAAIQSVADVRAGGVAVEGWVGTALHAAAPIVFVSPVRVEGGLLRQVEEPGGAVLGRLIAADLAHAGVIVVSVWLLRRRAVG